MILIGKKLIFEVFGIEGLKKGLEMRFFRYYQKLVEGTFLILISYIAGIELSDLGLQIMNCFLICSESKQHILNFFTNHKYPVCSKKRIMKIFKLTKLQIK